MEYFKTIFLESVDDFIKNLDAKTQKKLLNVRLAEKSNDPKLLKKLTDEIWEFRIRFSNKQIRLLAFWDKRDNKNTLVIATNGFIKKRRKPQKQILIKQKNNERIFKRLKVWQN